MAKVSAISAELPECQLLMAECCLRLFEFWDYKMEDPFRMALALGFTVYDVAAGTALASLRAIKEPPEDTAKSQVNLLLKIGFMLSRGWST